MIIKPSKRNTNKHTDKGMQLHYWEIKGVELGFAKNYPYYSWLKENKKTKQDFVYDNDHNRVLLYHPSRINLKDYTIL